MPSINRADWSLWGPGNLQEYMCFNIKAMSTNSFNRATLKGIVLYRSLKESVPVITNRVYLGTTVCHAALDSVVISNGKFSIAVRSNTWNSRKVTGFNRCGWAYLSLGISRSKLKGRISRKF